MIGAETLADAMEAFAGPSGKSHLIVLIFQVVEVLVESTIMWTVYVVSQLEE
jgi:hypothetical protein